MTDDEVEWRCPKCGGWAFGKIADAEALARGEVVLTEIHCHSDELGNPFMDRYYPWNEDGTEYTGPFPRPDASKKLCGWKGKLCTPTK